MSNRIRSKFYESNNYISGKKARRAQIRQEKFKEIYQKQPFVGPSTKQLRNKQVKSLQNEKSDLNPSLMVLSLINLLSAFQKNQLPACNKKNDFETCSKAIDYNIQFLNQKKQSLCVPNTNTSYNITQQNQNRTFISKLCKLN